MSFQEQLQFEIHEKIIIIRKPLSSLKQKLAELEQNQC